MKYTLEKYPTEIQEELKTFIQDNPSTYSRRIKKHNPKLYGFILDNTPDSIKLSTRMYWILNDIYDFPKCEICGKEFRNGIQFNRGYPRYCRKCSNSVESDRTKNARKTNLEKFGCISNFGNRENREKGKQTLLKHYGVDHNWKSIEVRNNGKRTCKELYGDENYNNREKCKSTKLERYGNAFYNNPDKMRISWQEHINNDSGFLIKRLEKTKATRKERYGDENYNNKEKTKKTLIEKYGMLHGFYHKFQIDDQKFDSSYELAYYIWLRDHNVKFTHPCPFNIEYINEDTGSIKTYCPDFFVDNRIVEIKGNHFFKNNDPSTQVLINPYDPDDSTPKYKMKCMIEHKVIILSNSDCKVFLDYVNGKYGYNFIESHKIKV